MTSDDKIEALIHTPPVVPLSTRDRIERVIGWVAAAIAIAALTVAVLVGLNGSQIASCVNTDLGPRNNLSAKDAQAHIVFINAAAADAQSFGVLLGDILTHAPASKSNPDFLTYIKVHTNYVAAAAASAAQLSADQQMRSASPLGKC